MRAHDLNGKPCMFVAVDLNICAATFIIFNLHTNLVVRCIVTWLCMCNFAGQDMYYVAAHFMNNIAWDTSIANCMC